MHPTAHVVAIPAALASVWLLFGQVDPVLARKPLPDPCQSARYLVVGGPILGNAGGMQLGTTVSIDDLCSATAAKRFKINRKGVTQVMVKWSQCTGLTGAVVLRGKVLSGCGEFQGTLKAKKFKRTIDARRSTCGDGTVDTVGGEACDDGNVLPGDGCEPDCTKTPTTGSLPNTTTTITATTVPTTTVPTTTITTTTITVTTSPSSSTNPSTSLTTTTIAGTTTTHATTSTVAATTTTSTSSTTTLPKTVLGLTIVANPDPVAPGGFVTYELAATNRGPVGAVQAQLRMTLPASTFACNTPTDGGQFPTGCAATRDVVWALGSMAVGASRTVQIVVQIRGDAASGASLVANARLDDAAGSPQATAQATVIVQPSPPLALGLTDTPDPARVGEDLDYVLHFGNVSANALLNTQLTLQLPDGTSVVDAGGGTQSPGTITWSLGALNAGQVGERRVRVQVVDLAAGDPLVRVAHATIASGVAATHANAVTQVNDAALRLTMIAGPDPLAPAGLLTYQLTVANRGASAADQVQLGLTLPIGVFACLTPSDGGTLPEGCAVGRGVLWNLGLLAGGATRSVQLVIQIRGDVPTASVLSTTARVQDGSGARARATMATIVQAAAPLDLVLTTDADPVQVGDALEYVLRFGNLGANALLSTQLALVLPAGTMVLDAGGGTQSAGTITWSLGALNAAQTGERRVRVHVDDLAPDEPGIRAARAVIASGAAAARADVVTQVQPATLGVQLIAQPDPLVPAGLLTYQVTATNLGATDSQQAGLRLTLPSGIFACAPASDDGTTPDGCAAGRDVVWNLGTIVAGTSRTVQLVIQIRGDVPTATVLSTAVRLEDAAGSRARATVSTTVDSTPTLGLVLATSGDPVQVGDALEYVLRFGNVGAASLLGTQLALTLPSGLTVLDAGGGTAAAGTITWALGTLDPTVTGERRVRVEVVDLGAADPLVRPARAAVTSGAEAARAATLTQVQLEALGLAMTAQPDPLAPAGLLTYALTISNRGVDDAVQVELRATLPVGLSACIALSDGGTTPDGCAAGRDAFWSLGTIAAGTSRTVQLVIQIRGDVAPGSVLASIARAEDANGSRARAAATTSVQSTALGLALTTDADPVAVGSDVDYTLRFGNHGASALLATQLVFAVPAGATVVDAGGGTAAGGAITWSLGTINAGARDSRHVTVHVQDLAPDEPLVRVARAAISSGAIAARAGAVTQVGSSPLGLQMTAQPDPLAPAGMLTYQLTVANDGPGDAVQVELRMTLPVGLFACGTISDAGQTPQGCAAGRDVVWSLGTIGAGAMRTVQAVIQIRGDVPAGTVLVTNARVQDAAGARARAALTTGVGS